MTVPVPMLSFFGVCMCASVSVPACACVRVCVCACCVSVCCLCLLGAPHFIRGHKVRDNKNIRDVLYNEEHALYT